MSPRKKALIFLATLAFAAVLAGGWATYSGVGALDVVPATRELEDAARKYRAAGLPWTAADLKLPAIKDSDNAALVLNKAWAGVPRTLELDAKQAYDHAKKRDPKLQQVLDRYSNVLAAAEKASRLPAADFGHDPDLLPIQPHREIGPTVSTVRLLCARAMASASKDNVVGTCADLAVAHKLSVFTGCEAAPAAYANKIRCRAVLLHACQICAQWLCRDAHALTRLRATIAPMAPECDFAAAIRGEAYATLSFARNRDVFDGHDGQPEQLSPDADIQRSGLPSELFIKPFLCRELQLWTEIYKIEHEGLTAKVRAVLMANVSYVYEHQSGFSYLFASRDTSVARGANIRVSDSALLKVTSALLAALEIRAKTGNLPDSIDQIPGKWIDPWTDGPLKLQREGDGIVIYSLGKDGIDSHGRTYKQDPQSDDISARFPVG